MKKLVVFSGLAACFAISSYDAAAQTVNGAGGKMPVVTPKVPPLPYRISAVAALAAWHSDFVEVPFQIKNVSEKPMLFVPPLDGSFSMRFPRVTVEMTDQEGRVVAARDAAWCGVTNSLREEDFTTLQPDETRAFMVEFLAPGIPGEYSLRVVYDTRERDPRFWLGSQMPTEEAKREAVHLAARIVQVPPVRLVSETVAFSVKGAKIEQLDMLFYAQIVKNGATPEEAEQISRDGQNGLWRLEEKREFAGHFSAVLRLAPAYKLPPSPVSFPTGRYLFAPNARWRQAGDSSYPLGASYVVLAQSQAAQFLKDSRVAGAENILGELQLADKAPQTPIR